MHDRTGKEDFVKIAVIILTHNEEAHIGACIRSAAFADEILVIDDESEDLTREIAAEAGARVISHPLAGDFAAQRNFALTQTTADWVLYLDADERVSPAAGETMRRIAEENPKAAYEIKRVNIAFGQKMRYGGHRPDLCLRFFPRDAVRWEGLVHERARTELPVRRLAGELYHYTYTSWDRYFQKFNQYTTLMAQRQHAAGKTCSFAKVLLDPPFAFFRFYILQGGILEGRLGFVLGAFHAFYTMAKYVKLYYMQAKD